MKQMRTLRNDKGFTLVELAIVLVIIGILLGGIIKGQELIKNAKYKRLYSTYREVIAGTYTYYDRYGKYPGDDNTVVARWGTGANGNGDGYIDETVAIWCAGGTAGENCLAWQDMRLAGILTGSTTNANGRIAPNHAFGGRVALLRSSAIFGGTYNKPFTVCFEWLPNEVAAWLDRTYDDGIYNTGSTRGDADYMVNPDQVSAQYTCLEG
jgi:prepilin-type N-terminal cleavage/methylation domain-containing protein